MQVRCIVLLLVAILMLPTDVTASAQSPDPDRPSAEAGATIVAPGGYGRFDDDSMVDSLLTSVRERLSVAECADLFGGRSNALDLLSKTSVNYVNPDASNLPDRRRCFPAASGKASSTSGSS